MNENKKVIIKCIVHRSSSFVEGNINHVSIQQELCFVYNALFRLNFHFVSSFNNSTSNLIIENLPMIIFGYHTIKKGNIHYFLKELVRIKDVTSLVDPKDKDKEIMKIEFENLERMILSDLQILLNYYNYIQINDKTSFFYRFVKSLYQPYKALSSINNDSKMIKEISKFMGVSTKVEALAGVKNINEKIENFLLEKGEEYIINLDNREINSLDILIYSAVKVQRRVLGNKSDEMILKSTITLVNEIDRIILNNTKIKNEFSIMTVEEYVVPKMYINKYLNNFRTFENKNFGRYLDCPKLTQEEKTRIAVRKTAITAFFFACLFILKVSFNK